jgi:predicted phosphodiesterase
MRFAVIADIHANLPALTAVLEAIDRERISKTYCLGDVIGIGPFPAETLATVLAHRGVTPVMGNHDSWFAHGLPQPRPEWMTEGEEAHHRWVHAQLDPAMRSAVQLWPWRIEERFNDLGIDFQHYALASSGRDFKEIVRQPTVADLDSLFQPNATTGLVLYGHHHPISDLHGAARYVNPGSLGCFSAPVARYAVVDVEPHGAFEVIFRGVEYDDSPVFRELEQRQVPERALIKRAFFPRG